MKKEDWLGIAYVSAWVIIWGSAGSLIDLPLLESNVYLPGSLGQIATFTLSGIVSSIIAIYLFPNFIERFNKI
mgnify:CR=1 FL=1